MPAPFNFTKKALDALPSPPAGQRSTARDTHTPGLELRVTASGAKTFSWFRRVKNGDPQRVTIGRFPDTSVDQARTVAARLNGALADGLDPAAQRRQARTELRFGDLFDQYIERHAKTRKKTWQEDKQRYDQYLASSLGAKAASTVTRQQIQQIHESITAAGHPAVANRVLALVSTVFGRGLEWSLVSENPAKGIRRNRERPRDRFLRSDELPRFFDALSVEPNETIRDYIFVSLLTGARRANVLSMKWSDLSLEEGVWRIPVTKNGEAQNVVLVPQVVERLRHRHALALKPDAFVFPGVGARGHLVEPRKAWLRLFDRDEFSQIVKALATAGHQFVPLRDARGNAETDEALGSKLLRAKARARAMGVEIDGLRMTGLRIHDLRRTLGSWQAMGGASLSIIGKGLGHKNVATTAIYARLQLDPVRSSVQDAVEAMLSAGNP